MNAPFIRFPPGSTVRIDGVFHTFMLVEDAGYVLRSEVDGRTNTLDSNQIAALYFAGKLEIPRQVHPGLPAGVRDNLRRTLTEFAEGRQAEAMRRLDYVKAIDGLEDRRRNGGLSLFRRTTRRYAAVARAVASARRLKGSKEKTPSPSTLREWFRRWERSGGEPAALVRLDDRKGRKPAELDPVLAGIVDAAVRTFYLREERPTVRALHEYVQGKVNAHNQETGARLTPLTETALHRFIGGRFGAREVYEAREGKRKGAMRFAAKGRRPSPGRLCEVVQIDHALLDIIVTRDRGGPPLETEDGAPRRKRGIAGRPWLSVAICAASRCVIGWWISLDPPSYVSVMMCMRSMLSKKPDVTVNGRVVQNPCFGLPKVMLVDNGKEFHSKALKAAAAQLGFEVRYCPRRQPWEKGRVERFFGEVQRNFADVPGRTFSGPDKRGEYDAARHARFRMTDIREMFGIWSAAYYHQGNHRGLYNRTPLEVWRELSIHGVDMPPRATDVALATGLPLSKPIKDTGIEYLNLRWDSDELQRLRDRYGLRRKWSCVLDPTDLTTLRVWDDTVEPNVPLSVPCQNPEEVRGMDLDMWKRVKNRSKERTPADEKVRQETRSDARVELFERARRDDLAGKPLSKPKQKFADEAGREAARMAALTRTAGQPAREPPGPPRTVVPPPVYGSVATRSQHYD